MAEKYNLIQSIKTAVSRVVVGRERTIDLMTAAFLCGGHVLLEDVPGTGKTLLAKTMAKALDLDFQRIQFTPDLMPSDVTGLNYYNQKAGEFIFKAGPVFTNILLADEINRATPRTQSALLECMEEHQVTTDGETRKLEEPFFVIATQNPIETGGTYPLPEAQMDRFVMQLSMGLPNLEEELAILERFEKDNPLDSISPVCGKKEILKLREKLTEIYIHPVLMKYIVSIVEGTREQSSILHGASPRGTLALMRVSKAYAMGKGRDYVVPEDIKETAVPVLAHRLVLSQRRGGSQAARKAVQDILGSVPVPTEEWKR